MNENVSFRFWNVKNNQRSASMAICFILYALLTTLLAVSLSLSFSVINARKCRKRAVGFFHPYTNDGGGGERVLWCAVKAIQEETPDLDCVVFTGDHDSSSDSLARRAVDRFGVHLLFPPKVRSNLQQLHLFFSLFGFNSNSYESN